MSSFSLNNNSYKDHRHNVKQPLQQRSTVPARIGPNSLVHVNHCLRRQVEQETMLMSMELAIQVMNDYFRLLNRLDHWCSRLN